MDIENIGQIIKEARKQKGYTQKKLAELLDCTVAHLGRIEIGSVNPSIKLLTKMFAILPFIFNNLFTQHQDPAINKEISLIIEHSQSLRLDQLRTLSNLARLMVTQEQQ